MTQIQLTDGHFYRGGQSTQTPAAGWDAQTSLVARYTLLAPACGATAVSLRLEDVALESGQPMDLAFLISGDSESYAAADYTYPYQGALTYADGALQGEATVYLAPGSTYYLWVFPGSNLPGTYRLPQNAALSVTEQMLGVATLGEGPYVLGQPIALSVQGRADCTYRLYWEMEGRSGLIGQTQGEALTWTPEAHLAELFPNSAAGLCAISCYTYRGGALEGPAQCVRISLAVPQSMAPAVSMTWEDTSKAWAAFGTLTAKVSRLAVTVEASGQYGAGISGTGVLLDGKVYTGGTLSAGDHTLTATATDSRGLTGSATATISVTAYQAPQLTLSASRCRADGTADDTGDHARVNLFGTVTALPGNTAAVTFTYGSAKRTIAVALGSFSQTLTIPADPNDTLLLKATLSDAVRSTNRSMTLSIGYATVDFLAGGRGIAFGTVATGEGFRCAMDAQFLGRVQDNWGRDLVSVRQLESAMIKGTGIALQLGRLVRALDSMTLQLRFFCNTEVPAGQVLFDDPEGLFYGITDLQTLPDATGQYLLKVYPTQLVTETALPPGTYLFHCPLY